MTYQHKLVKNVKMGDIHPSELNIRIRRKSAVDAVKTSIKKYGYNVPIVVDSNYNIVAGHTRYDALLQLKHKAIDVIVLDPAMTEVELDKLRLLDNKIGEASEWDTYRLGVELRYINDSKEDKEDWTAFSSIFSDTEAIDKYLQQSVGQLSQVVTSAQVSQAQDREAIRYQTPTKMELVEVTCPNCGHTFKFKNTF